MKYHVALWIAVIGLSLQSHEASASSPYARWTNSFPTNESFFPIAVWVQNPRNAERYKAAGINTYVGLWRGPTRDQLEQLERARMLLVCHQNGYALSNIQNRTIAAWMHGDEPDNAQSLGTGKGYGPPIKPEVIQRDYDKLRAADPSRPVLLNLGQGVAYDNYIGRGVRRNKPEDYPEYIRGCDIASFDIYPVVHDKPEVRGKLEFVARGVERLVQWSGGENPVWNCIECTHIGDPDRKATPAQVRSEVWMALISGSRGLIYFVHQFKPTFNEAALLSAICAPPLAHWLTGSLAHWLTHSPTHPLTHSPTHPLTHSPTPNSHLARPPLPLCVKRSSMVHFSPGLRSTPLLTPSPLFAAIFSHDQHVAPHRSLFRR